MRRFILSSIFRSSNRNLALPPPPYLGFHRWIWEVSCGQNPLKSSIAALECETTDHSLNCWSVGMTRWSTMPLGRNFTPSRTPTHTLWARCFESREYCHIHSRNPRTKMEAWRIEDWWRERELKWRRDEDRWQFVRVPEKDAVQLGILECWQKTVCLSQTVCLSCEKAMSFLWKRLSFYALF